MKTEVKGGVRSGLGARINQDGLSFRRWLAHLGVKARRGLATGILTSVAFVNRQQAT